MTDPTVADTYGAMDLSAMAADQSPEQPQTAAVPPFGEVPAESGATVSAPLIVSVSDANFEEEMALSQTVPVVLIFFSGKSLVSQQAVTTLEDAARQYAGAFQLGKVDVDTHGELAQALQIQTLPTAMALVARRPVPLFEGPATAEQFDSLMAELLQVAPQLGVTGKIAVDAEALEKPLPAAHQAPREAEMADDWELAVSLWKKVLAGNPADKEAKLALARAEFEARQVEATGSGELADADALFAKGQEEEAYDLLLGIVAQQQDADQKEAARARLVELLNLGSNPEAVKEARKRLANMLLV